MKKIIKITLSLLFIAASFTSCVDDKDFDTPQVTCDDTEINAIDTNAINSIENVINKWKISNPGSYDANRVDFSSIDADDIYLEGYVTSSDFKGNFYKELFIQDKVENPTAAIKIVIDKRGLYSKYPVGSRLLIKLNGLSINKSHGEMIIGEKNEESNVDAIRSKVADTNILRNCTAVDIIPIEIDSASNINEDMIGQYIKLNGVQFHLDVLGLPYVNPADTYDSHRKIVFCEDKSYIRLETSGFSAYAETILPSEKFSISGILSRDYGDDFYVLKINSPDDISVNDSDRCDPIREDLNCGDVSIPGTVIIFEENFNSISNESQLDTAGWTNINVNDGENRWKYKSYQGDEYMQIGAYQTNENPLESWLVTPAINLDGYTNTQLTFNVKAGYYNGDALSVYILSNYSGDVTMSDLYTLQDLTLPTGPSSGYGSFISVGDVDLSCLSGDVYIAFKYFGMSDGGVTTTIQIDDIMVTGNN